MSCDARYDVETRFARLAVLIRLEYVKGVPPPPVIVDPFRFNTPLLTVSS